MNKVIFLFDADTYNRDDVEAFTFEECEKRFYEERHNNNNDNYNIIKINLNFLENCLNDGWDIFCNCWARVFI